MHLRLHSLLPVVCFMSVPSMVSAEVLWRGDFETGDLSQWGSLLNPTKGERKNINVVMTPVHGGTRAGEVVIHPDDLWQGNNHNRVELHYDAVEGRTAEGQTTFFSFYFRLPADTQTTNDIAYWETANSYQQSMAFWLEPMGGSTQLSFRTNQPSGMTHYKGSVTIEAWHQLAMQILWSENASTGRVSAWLDGQKIVNDVAAKTKPDSNRVFVQVGYHRNATATPIETIHLDDAIEATTLAEVLALPSGNGGSGGVSATGGAAAGGAAGQGGGAPNTGGAGEGALAGSAGHVSGGAPGASGGAAQASGGTASGGASAGGIVATGGAQSASGAAGNPSVAGSTGTSGASASGGRGGVGGSDPGAAGGANAPGAGKGSEGCGCRFGDQPTAAWPLALLAALGAALVRRRRLDNPGAARVHIVPARRKGLESVERCRMARDGGHEIPSPD
jgi:MYXO-CTERM domain-containing protein